MREKKQPKSSKPHPSKSPRKAPRLGRGLSSLIGPPMQVHPPAVVEEDMKNPMGEGSDHAITGTQIESSSGVKPPADSTADSRGTSGVISGEASGGGGKDLVYLPIDSIRANPHQPRKSFDAKTLDQLAESIERDGLLQPIIVRRNPQASDGNDAGYELVAGERRLRAAQQAGLTELPAMVQDVDDQQTAQLALIENLQREDLNPIDRAHAFQHLIDQFGLSHDGIAQQVGVERPTISNSLRLLNLCDILQAWVRDGLLSTGQAKVLVSVADPGQQQAIAEMAIKKNWSVRQIEQEVRQLTKMSSAGLESVAPTHTNRAAPYLGDLEQQIGSQLNTKVRVRRGRKKGSGSLLIEFYSLDQFDELLDRLGVQTQ